MHNDAKQKEKVRENVSRERRIGKDQSDLREKLRIEDEYD